MTPRRLLPILALSALALSACTSTDVLEPSAIARDAQSAPAAGALTTPTTGTGNNTSTTAQAPVTAGAATAAPSQAGAATSALPAVTRLQFAPIVGTTVEAAAPLSERLAQRARERGITIVRSGEPQSHILKGYFSALPEGKQTTIVYVWDVLDAAGNRLHRIQGQQAVEGGDGWPSVKPQAMQAIADQTMEQLSGWLRGTSPG